MDVVGHDNETASEPTVARRAVKKECSETLESVIVVEDTGAALHAYRQEIGNVPIAIRPNAV
jgi:hypothetical protein